MPSEASLPSDLCRVAIVGTLRREIGPLVRRLLDRRVTRAGGQRFLEGQLAGGEVVMTATGGGATLARRGVEALLDRFPVDRMLAVGVAGGLTPDLDVGTVVVARQVWNGAAAVPPPEESWLEAVLERTAAVEATVVNSERIAGDPTTKADLWRLAGGEGSAAVDLESAAFARAAAAHGLPYLVIRAISDTADETLPLDFDRFRDQDGRIVESKVLLHALMRPRLLRPLLRLRGQVRDCAESLAEVAEEALRR
ncbi:MAG: hypothetical protein V3R89_03425 [Thermoanaerobaculia bacterium]